MTTKKSTLLLSTFCFLLTACYQYKRPESVKFDKHEWSIGGDGIVYPNRDKMLDDLLQNHNLKGLTYKQLIDTLGQPPDYDNIYEIVVYYKNDIDPRHVKVLEFTFDKDSIVANWKLIKNPPNY